MVGTGLGARRWRSGALAVAVLVALAGCTPPPETATVVNETGLTLVPDGVRVEGDPIPPGGVGKVRWYGEDCLPALEFGTAERTARVVRGEEVCDDDTVTVTADSVIDASAAATVVNASRTDLTVTVRQWSGANELRDVPVAAGAERELLLMIPAGSCAAGRAFVTVAIPGTGPTGDDGDRGRTVIHPGELCDGEVWTIDDAAVEAGSAVVALTNGTDRELRVWLNSPDWEFTTWLGPGETKDMTLGAQPGECVDGAVYGETSPQRDAEEWRLERQGPICPGVWEITTADLTHYERGLGWVPLPQDG